jgi:hypothetical protein
MPKQTLINKLQEEYGEKFVYQGKHSYFEHNEITLSINIQEKKDGLEFSFYTIENAKRVRVSNKNGTNENFIPNVISKLEAELKLREQKMISELKLSRIKELEQMSIKAYTNQFINLDDYGFNEHASGINLSFNKNTVSVSRPKRMKWDANKKFRCVCDMKFTNEEYSKFLNFLCEMETHNE